MQLRKSALTGRNSRRDRPSQSEISAVSRTIARASIMPDVTAGFATLKPLPSMFVSNLDARSEFCFVAAGNSGSRIVPNKFKAIRTGLLSSGVVSVMFGRSTAAEVSDTLGFILKSRPADAKRQLSSEDASFVEDQIPFTITDPSAQLRKVRACRDKIEGALTSGAGLENETAKAATKFGLNTLSVMYYYRHCLKCGFVREEDFSHAGIDPFSGALLGLEDLPRRSVIMIFANSVRSCLPAYEKLKDCLTSQELHWLYEVFRGRIRDHSFFSFGNDNGSKVLESIIRHPGTDHQTLRDFVLDSPVIENRVCSKRFPLSEYAVKRIFNRMTPEDISQYFDNFCCFFSRSIREVRAAMIKKAAQYPGLLTALLEKDKINPFEMPLSEGGTYAELKGKRCPHCDYHPFAKKTLGLLQRKSGLSTEETLSLIRIVKEWDLFKDYSGPECVKTAVLGAVRRAQGSLTEELARTIFPTKIRAADAILKKILS
ncbi:MAG: hypothetical protein NTZ10_02490 [Candidatus Saganbacteria bacterium]|nr:hypothetical protein [Candidatus Saganbacteria bacterium]